MVLIDHVEKIIAPKTTVTAAPVKEEPKPKEEAKRKKKED